MVSCELRPGAQNVMQAHILCFSWNHGQACCAGSRIFVQEGIYDKFMEKFVEKAKSIKIGDPFASNIDQGPQVSQIQYDVRKAQLSSYYV